MLKFAKHKPIEDEINLLKKGVYPYDRLSPWDCCHDTLQNFTIDCLIWTFLIRIVLMLRMSGNRLYVEY